MALKEGSSKPKVSLSFELTRSSLIQLNKAEAKVDEIYIVEEKVKKAKKESSTNTTSETSEDSAEQTTDSEPKSETDTTSDEA